MIRISNLTPALAAAAIGILTIAPGAVAAPPAAQDLNPPPPDFYDCKPLGGVTICTASLHEEKVSEPQPELVCGTGADAFVIHDTGVIDQSWTRWYDADGNLTKRSVPYTQTGRITTELAVPGDFDSAVETTVGENVYTDPATHRKVLTTAGRVVFGADGSLESQAGQQPFIDAFVNGDMTVFEAVCAALA
jgi:hypothetical protein